MAAKSASMPPDSPAASSTAKDALLPSTTQGVLLQHPELHSPTLPVHESMPNLTEDDVEPAPAYGSIYGELCNDKKSNGASARVTDDGRVNIRINSLNRRLSQTFTPALRQQLQKAQDSGSPPPPYIPASPGGDERAPPPPRMNVVMHIVGSRGDVQPYVYCWVHFASQSYH